jgi:HK97 family phage prohead protease
MSVLECATTDRSIATILPSVVKRKLSLIEGIERDRRHYSRLGNSEFRSRALRALDVEEAEVKDDYTALRALTDLVKKHNLDDWRSRIDSGDFEGRIAAGPSYPAAGVAMQIDPAATSGLGGAVPDGDVFDGLWVIGGVVAPWGDYAILAHESRSRDASVVEHYEPGCFTRALADLASGKRPIVGLHNHELLHPLGTTKNGTLHVGLTDAGLAYRLSLDKNNSDHRNLYANVASGLVSGASLGFHTKRDKFAVDSQGVYRRALLDLDVRDVSPTAAGAYGKATCHVIRSQQAAQRSAQRRSFPSAAAPVTVPPEVRRAITPPPPRNDALRNRVASLVARVAR